MNRTILVVATLCLSTVALAKDGAPYQSPLPSATLTIGPGGFVRGPITVTLSDGTVIFHVDAGSTVGTSAPAPQPVQKDGR
ncbi:MAG: hypothetical protein HY243_17820 [Proteobacteria bacterium]|nr:hypothetical protein [Pseudomonadota bacterium]